MAREHHYLPKQHTTNDLSDDTRLTEFRQWPMKQSTEDDDDSSLDDKEDDRVLGIVDGRIRALKDATLGCSA